MGEWVQVTVEVPERAVPVASDTLEAAGALSVTVTDAGDDPVYEPLPGETRAWTQSRVTGLFAAPRDPGPLREALHAALGTPPAGWRVARLADRDWERAWLDDYRPMRFGRRLWVGPSDAPAPDPDAVTLRLDPGLAFGTGTHATTALCLDWLADAAPAARVLDYGCGSGILAIAALLLGGGAAHAVDIDPQALVATRRNAAANGVAAHLAVGAPEALTDDARFDLVLANILAGPLADLAPRLAARVAPGGTLVLSGLLEAQVDAVAAAYAGAFAPFAVDLRDGWARLVARRR